MAQHKYKNIMASLIKEEWRKDEEKEEELKRAREEALQAPSPPRVRARASAMQSQPPAPAQVSYKVNMKQHIALFISSSFQDSSSKGRSIKIPKLQSSLLGVYWAMRE